MIDFGKIGDIASKFFDSDYIDIKRDMGGKLQEVYSNIPCHVAYASTDNPDPTTVDIKPVIQSITVHCPLYVDIRNNDFIVAKKIGSDGSLIATYSGRCGNPVVSQGRKKALMQMSGTEADEPTPIPPKEGAEIRISFISDGMAIQDSQTQKAEIGKPFEMEAPIIEGFTPSECYIDDVLQETTTARIDSVSKEGNRIQFIYAVSETPEFFRFLVNGLYTKDDGSLASGWHLYKKRMIKAVNLSDDVYTITCTDIQETHEDGGQKLKIDAGTRIVLIPGNVFVEVSEIVNKDSGNVTFNAVPFEPTEAERNAYVCGYYD